MKYTAEYYDDYTDISFPLQSCDSRGNRCDKLGCAIINHHALSRMPFEIQIGKQPENVVIDFSVAADNTVRATVSIECEPTKGVLSQLQEASQARLTEALDRAVEISRFQDAIKASQK